MAGEDTPLPDNAEEGPERNGLNGPERRAPGAQSPRKATDAERPKRAPRQPPVNAIAASRRARKPRARRSESRSGEEIKSSATPAAAASPVQRADSDPWTVPQSVRDRFVQDGNRFFFPDGAAAFKDLGRKLTTASENTQVVHSLIQIARSRGWTEVSVTGTERFREEAWRQGRLAGLNIRGYRPSEEQQAQLIRAIARNPASPSERADSVSSEPTSTAPRSTEPQALARSSGNLGADARPSPQERIAGRLLEHGRDSYRHDPHEEASYFVRLQTLQGAREVWGKDIERAVAKSLTQPKVGDEVILQRTGREAVTVRRSEKDPGGQVSPREVGVYRNRWVIEKREFFEERDKAASTLRDTSIEAREGTQKHPELAGSYLNLRAAELVARRMRDPQDQLRFVALVRGALADSIARGEPLQPVRLRERASVRRPLGRQAPVQEQVPVRG